MAGEKTLFWIVMLLESKGLESGHMRIIRDTDMLWLIPRFLRESQVGCKANVTIPDGNETYVLNGKDYKKEKLLIELRSGKYIIDYKLNR